MFKVVALSFLLAVVAAKPANIKTAADVLTTNSVVQLTPTTVVHQPYLAKVGEYVASVPTSISHQSSTIVHDRANVVTPIVAPAVKTTHIGPIYRTANYIPPFTRSYSAAYPQYPLNFYYGGYPYGYKFIY